jgi:hypothetical protein
MATYNGPVTIIRADDTEIPATALLRSFTNGYLGEWTGRLTLSVADFQTLFNDPDARIRLRNGAEGKVLFSNPEMHMSPSSQNAHIDVSGNGDCPF